MDAKQLRVAIEQDEDNLIYTKQGIHPLYTIHPEAKVVIIGQAPGKKAQASQIVWHDQSGKRLRSWLGLSDETFYQSHDLAILPMDFYYPGKGKTGDLPPRKAFAAKWHPLCLKLMPDVQLIILVGRYAQAYYLPHNKANLTTTVQQFQTFLPQYFPLPHPSPLNGRWLKKNPWFEQTVVPQLKEIISTLVN
ncbi:uracil-DNA glycosylase family protein [Enterococcus italicus]|uniref:uracil-DNA glycosylase family protein n=1 Tax=Enterococcus italicus TaxID=246144 RepID=UPI003F45E9CB